MNYKRSVSHTETERLNDTLLDKKDRKISGLYIALPLLNLVIFCRKIEKILIETKESRKKNFIVEGFNLDLLKKISSN